MQKANPSLIRKLNLNDEISIYTGAIVTGLGAGGLISASAVTGGLALGIAGVGALAIAAVPGIIIGITVHETIQYYSGKSAENTPTQAPSIDEQLKQQQKPMLNKAKGAVNEAQASSQNNLNQQKDLLHKLGHTHKKAADAVDAAANAAKNVEKIIRPLNTIVNNTTKTLNEITRQLRDAELDIVELKKTIATLTIRLSEKEHSLGTGISHISKNQKNLETNVSLATTHLAKLPSQLHYLDELVDMRAKIKAKDDELSALKATLNSVRAKNSEQLTTIQRLTSELNGVLLEKNRLARTLNSLSTTLLNQDADYASSHVSRLTS